MPRLFAVSGVVVVITAAVASLSLAATTARAGLMFDIDANPGHSTCFVFTIDSYNELEDRDGDNKKAIYVKYYNNWTGTPMADAASDVHVTVLDPSGRALEGQSYTLPPSPFPETSSSKSPHTKWTAITVKPGKARHSVLGMGSYALGEYNVCFVRIASPAAAALAKTILSGFKSSDDSSGQQLMRVELNEGDPRTKSHLQRHIEHQHRDTPEAIEHRAVARNSPTGECTEDDLEEVIEWLDDVESVVRDVCAMGLKNVQRQNRFLITSNSIFSRIWFVSFLTLVVIAATTTGMYKGVSKMLRRRKLV